MLFAIFAINLPIFVMSVLPAAVKNTCTAPQFEKEKEAIAECFDKSTEKNAGWNKNWNELVFCASPDELTFCCECGKPLDGYGLTWPAKREDHYKYFELKDGVSISVGTVSDKRPTVIKEAIMEVIAEREESENSTIKFHCEMGENDTLKCILERHASGCSCERETKESS